MSKDKRNKLIIEKVKLTALVKKFQGFVDSFDKVPKNKMTDGQKASFTEFNDELKKNQKELKKVTTALNKLLGIKSEPEPKPKTEKKVKKVKKEKDDEPPKTDNEMRQELIIKIVSDKAAIGRFSGRIEELEKTTSRKELTEEQNTKLKEYRKKLNTRQNSLKRLESKFKKLMTKINKQKPIIKKTPVTRPGKKTKTVTRQLVEKPLAPRTGLKRKVVNVKKELTPKKKYPKVVKVTGTKAKKVTVKKAETKAKKATVKKTDDLGFYEIGEDIPSTVAFEPGTQYLKSGVGQETLNINPDIKRYFVQPGGSGGLIKKTPANLKQLKKEMSERQKILKKVAKDEIEATKRRIAYEKTPEFRKERMIAKKNQTILNREARLIRKKEEKLEEKNRLEVIEVKKARKAKLEAKAKAKKAKAKKAK